MGDNPVYQIQAETGDRTLRVLHCNLLLPVNDLPLEHDGQDNQTQKRQRQNLHRMNSQHQMSDALEPDTSDSGDEEGYPCNPRLVPVYERKRVIPKQFQGEPHSHLRVAAPEFHPVHYSAESDNLETYEQQLKH
ncbi:uncharacterized protein LOC113098974, partial [Tachysurus ichikawai]